MDDWGSTSFGRIVAMIYLDHNSTHLLNVNLYMVVNGFAVFDDFTNNEFSPSNWELYVDKNDDGGNDPYDPNDPSNTFHFTFPIAIVLVVGMILLGGIIGSRVNNKSRVNRRFKKIQQRNDTRKENYYSKKINNIIYLNGNNYKKFARTSTISRETDKAILANRVWFPKSQVIYKNGYIYVTEWMLEQKGLK